MDEEPLADLPFSTTRIFIYNVAIYFMTRLDRSAGGFGPSTQLST
jgi:hypothetical protein